MSRKNIYMYVMDTLADWECGYAIAELNSGRFFKKDIPAFTVKTFALSKEPVISMGGLKIIPDLSLDELQPQDCALLLLPGGNLWMESKQLPVIEKAADFLQKGIPVAAICGATMALASAGVLDGYKHTSNDLNYLKEVCPNYKGEKNYVQQSVVTDGNLITASGVAALEFAYHIFKKLDVMSGETLDALYSLYKTQETQYFYRLLGSIEKD